jgi:hypothetical protein
MKKGFKYFNLVVWLCLLLISCGGGGSDAPPPAPAPPTTLVAFATSAQGTGDLSTWTDAGGAHGVAAGDNICQAAATTAGLSGTFKAWLSDSTTDAYCHVQGLTGTILTKCGQGTLPTAAGPWVRTDGYPFAPTIDNLVNNNQVFAPVVYDESGNPLFAFTLYYTGTKANGKVDVGTCNNWTYNNSDTLNTYYAQFGGTEDASGWWTARGGVGCDGPVNLLCLQTGAGKPLPSLPAVPSGAKRVFVTSVQGTGNLTSWTDYSGIATGVAAGDQICQNRAAAAGLANAGNYKAWLSDTSTDAIDHVTAGASSDGPFYRLDDVKIAENKGTLKIAPLFTAIAVNEYGAYITGDLWVWSGTDDTGIKHANRCTDWASNASGDHGRIGEAPTASTYWTNFTNTTCDNSAALYCFEDD